MVVLQKAYRKEITNSQISEGIVKFKIDDKSINGEGAYTFQAKLVDVQNQKESDLSSPSELISLDFSPPEKPKLELVFDSNTNSNTDTGTSNQDGITNDRTPIINLTSEPNLKTSDIFLDISDGQGTGRFNKGSLKIYLFLEKLAKGLFKEQLFIL